MSTVTTSQAAAKLKVSPEAVRKMVRTGRLMSAGHAGRTLLIDQASLQRVALGGRHTGRLWAPRTAWAALALLSGQKAPWLGSSEKYRLRKSLQSLAPEDVYLLSRNRAVVRRYRATPSASLLVLQRVVPTAGSAMRDASMSARFGLASGPSDADGYVMSGEAEEVAAAYGMVEDPAGDVVLRETGFAEPFTADIAPTAAVAVDLMDSLAARERAAGARVLSEMLRA